MIELLEWDSRFFGRRMAVLRAASMSKAQVEADLRAAADDGIEYVLSRPPLQDVAAVRLLQESGFYLADLGVTWVTDVAQYRALHGDPPSTARPATADDVPLLARHATTLFRGSRFYHDPFFTIDEADRLHAEWVANSVSGQAASAVWIVPEAGFVTCKLARDGTGEIVLIGVWEGCRRKGAGRALMNAAIAWFASQQIGTVTVRTQLTNTGANRFYQRLRFDFHASDITLARSVTPAGGRARG